VSRHSADFPDRIFFRELDKGYAMEAEVAARLGQAGVCVEHAPMQVRETYEQRARFRNQKDLLLPDGQVIEVKSSSRPFTCCDDVQFANVHVAEVQAWERKDPTPVAVVLVSQVTKAMVVIPTRSRRSWITATVHDQVRNVDQTVYQCPRGQLREWPNFVAWLLARPAQRYMERPFTDEQEKLTYAEWASLAQPAPAR